MRPIDKLKEAFGIGIDPNAMNERYGVTQGAVNDARGGALQQLAMTMIAAGQPMTGAQRGQILANSANIGGQFQNNIYNAQQARLMQKRTQMAEAADERERMAVERIRQMVGQLPDNDPRKRNAMIYLEMGDAGKAAEALQTDTDSNPYEIRGDSKSGLFYVHKTDPSVPPRLIPGTVAPTEGREAKPSDRMALWNAYEKAPEVVAYNVLQPTLQSLSTAVYDDSRVSDLDFVYGIAKALDPTSVVRESEAGMVIDSQGIDAQMLARLNSLVGRGSLTPETREKLYELVARRANAYKSQAESMRNQILRFGEGMISQDDLRPLAPIPEIVRPQQRPAQQQTTPTTNPLVLPLIRVD